MLPILPRYICTALPALKDFLDGNKRTAVVAAVEFLGRNGYAVECDDLEMYDLTLSAANKTIKKEGAADWLCQRLKPIPDSRPGLWRRLIRWLTAYAIPPKN